MFSSSLPWHCNPTAYGIFYRPQFLNVHAELSALSRSDEIKLLQDENYHFDTVPLLEEQGFPALISP